MNTTQPATACSCQQARADQGLLSGARRTTKALPSMALSVFIAFFPKCPFCWAAYMSMFGSIGLARLPYLPWLLPLMIALLAAHVFILARKAMRTGYLPFAVSLCGALLIVTGRIWLPAEKPILIAGMIAIAAGSLLAHFLPARGQRRAAIHLISKTTT